MSLEFSADINYMEKTPPDTDCGHLDLKIGFNADWFFICSQYRKITENKRFFFSLKPSLLMAKNLSTSDR